MGNSDPHTAEKVEKVIASQRPMKLNMIGDVNSFEFRVHAQTVSGPEDPTLFKEKVRNCYE